MARVPACAFLLLILLGVGAQEVAAETYYIGEFKGSIPQDDGHCGTGKLTHPEPHPCATLAFWTEHRRSVLREGDTVRLAQGSHRSRSRTGYHCIAAQRGVTYEGRSASDRPADASAKVVVDLTGNRKDAVCFGRGVTCPNTRGCDASGFTVRDINFRNGAAQGVKLDTPKGVTTKGVLLERLRIVNFTAQGINISDHPSDVDCSTSGRRILDLTIRDSTIESNHGVYGGVAIGCVDGFLIENNTVRSNLPADCTWTGCESGACDCNDHDGIQLAGAINGVVRGNRVYNCGEDCIDVGGHWRKTYNITIERNWVYDGASRWFKLSGGAHHVTVRNNFFTGQGLFEIGTCEHDVDVYNNTLWRDGNSPVLKLWTKCHSCEFVNNIISGTTKGANDRIVIVSRANTHSSLLWNNNILHNQGRVGWMIREELGRGSCGNCNCSGRCEAPKWCPVPWPAAQRNNKLAAHQLERFQAEGDDGGWFGPESGDTDTWGTRPGVVNAEEPTAPNLHLVPGDSVARTKGRDLSDIGRCVDGACRKGSPGAKCKTDSDCAMSEDYDGDRRIGSWDVGADELNKAEFSVSRD